MTNKIKEVIELKNGLGEGLSYSDFKEYINDYYNNPEEYDIDQDSRYYEAIESSFLNYRKWYELYLTPFHELN